MDADLPVALPHLREAEIVRLCGLARAARGQECARTGGVRQAERSAGTLRAAVVDGAFVRAAQACFSDTGLDAWECECSPEPLDLTNAAPGLRPPCEHVAALLSLWVREPEQFRVVDLSAPSTDDALPEMRQRPAAPPEASTAAVLDSPEPAVPPIPSLKDLEHVDDELRRLLNLLALAGGSATEHEAQRLFVRLELGEPEAAEAALEQLHQLGFVQPIFATASASRHAAAVERIAGWSVPEAVLAFLPRELPLTPLPEALTPAVQQEQPLERTLPALLLLVAAQMVEQGASAPKISADPPPTSRSRLDLDAALAQQWAQPLETTPEQLRFCLALLRLLGILPLLDSARGTAQRQSTAIARPKVSPEQARETLLRAYRLLRARPEAEVRRDLFTHWLHAQHARELVELRDAGVRVAWLSQRDTKQMPALAAENQAARQAISNLLRWAPAGRWWSFSSLVEFVWRFQPGFLRGRQQTFLRPQWWLERLPDGEPLSPDVRAEWRQAEGRYIALLMRRALHWLGVVDLALDEQGRLKGFRVTPQGAALLGEAIASEAVESAAAPVPAASRPAALQLQEDGILLATLGGLQPEQLDMLLWWCEPAGATAEALRFRPTAERTGAALDAGQDVAAWLARLEAQPLSAALIALVNQVRQWAALYGQVRLYPSATLLEVADPALLGELEAALGLSARFIDHSLAPGLAVLRADTGGALVEEMQRRGYIPWITDHETVDRP